MARSITNPDRQAQALATVAEALAARGETRQARHVASVACAVGRWTMALVPVLSLEPSAARVLTAITGLHQLDGARYLRDAQDADAMLCRLVAHHSCAIIEAGERGLADILSSEFDPARYALASVLTCCDMTTSPDGEPVPVDRRLTEIHDRYGPGHLVSRSIQRATPMILRAVEQVHRRAAQTAWLRGPEAD